MTLHKTISQPLASDIEHQEHLLSEREHYKLNEMHDRLMSFWIKAPLMEIPYSDKNIIKRFKKISTLLDYSDKETLAKNLSIQLKAAYKNSESSFDGPIDSNLLSPLLHRLRWSLTPYRMIVSSQTLFKSLHGMNTAINTLLSNILGKVDARPILYRAMKAQEVGQAMRLCTLINPDSRPQTVLYGGFGADWITAALSTNVTELYAVDLCTYTLPKLENALEEITSKFASSNTIKSDPYLNRKFEQSGLVSYGKFEGAEKAIIIELAASGVPLDSVTFTGHQDHISITFQWAYQNEDSKPRHIRLFTADLTNPTSYPATLRAMLQENSLDVFIEKSGNELAQHYPTFLPHIVNALKPGGILLTTDYIITSSQQLTLSGTQDQIRAAADSIYSKINTPIEGVTPAFQNDPALRMWKTLCEIPLLNTATGELISSHPYWYDFTVRTKGGSDHPTPPMETYTPQEIQLAVTLTTLKNKQDILRWFNTVDIQTLPKEFVFVLDSISAKLGARPLLDYQYPHHQLCAYGAASMSNVDTRDYMATNIFPTYQRLLSTSHLSDSFKPGWNQIHRLIEIASSER